jgi:hypothetical protein
MINFFGHYLFIESIGRMVLWIMLLSFGLWVVLDLSGQGEWYERLLAGMMFGLPIAMFIRALVEGVLEDLAGRRHG